MNPETSIIVVTFNTKNLIAQCLDDLIPETNGLNTEIIVVDNGSNDGTTEELAPKYTGVKFIRTDVNQGFGGGNNIGIRQAVGRYVVLLNSDAFFFPGALIKAVKRMDENPSIGLAGGRLVGGDGGWSPSARMFPSLLNQFLMLSGLAAKFPKSRFFGRMDRTWADPSESAEVDWVPGAFLIIRKEVLDKVGGFDERFFLYYEEVDLCKRVKAAGFPVWYFADVMVKHLGGKTTSQSKNELFATVGAQLVLPNFRSMFLYFYKYSGYWGARSMRALFLGWHRLRIVKNYWSNTQECKHKLADSKALIKVIKQAWADTQGGRVSPIQCAKSP